MAKPRIRPTFDVPLETDADRVFRLLDERLRKKERDVGGWTQGHHAELHLEHDQHFFSPLLQVTAAEDAAGRRLTCRFAPLPQVWVVFVGIHFFVFLLGLCALVYGVVQLFLKQSPWALALVPVAAALSAFVAGAAFVGQGLAGDELQRLRSFLERTVEDAANAPPEGKSQQ